MKETLEFLESFKKAKDILSKDQLIEFLQIQLAQVELFEKILKGELAQLKGEEKKPAFQLLPQAPQMVSEAVAQEGELSAKDVDFASGLKYDQKYPPDDLIDIKQNRKILDLKIDRGMIFFLRTFRHPYRQTPPKEFYNALFWLIDVEGVPEEIVRYLLTGTGAETFEKQPYTEEMSAGLDTIDAITGQYSEAIKNNAKLIEVVPERIALIFEGTPFFFDEHLSKVFVENHLSIYGYAFDPNEVRVGNIKKLKKTEE